MVTSLDESHPGENIIDGSEQSYWISTGLYPQEILLQLSSPSKIDCVKLSTTNVKNVRVEASAEDNPVNFKCLAEGSLEEKAGRLQVKELRCNDQGEPYAYIKVLI